MSEKDHIISQHDVESSGCAVKSGCSKSKTCYTKKLSLLSERKCTPSIGLNQNPLFTNVIDSNEGNNLACLNSVNNFPSANRTEQNVKKYNREVTGSDLHKSLLITEALSESNKKMTKNEESDELTIPVSSLTLPVSSSPQTHTGDIVINSDLSTVEEWLKSRSDNLSNLDLYGEMKSEIDMTEFLNRINPKPSSSLTHNLNNPKLSTNAGIYSSEGSVSSSSLLSNSFHFENDGSLSSLPTNGFDNVKNKNGNANMVNKIDNFVQVDKGILEEMLLTDSLRKNFKIKDSMIGEEKGLFEELLIPGEQEWLLTVSAADKKDNVSVVSLDSVSVSQSPNNHPIGNQDETNKEGTFDEYDMIDRNINTLKLMTPQEIESMPSRSLGFDDGQYKVEEIGPDSLDLPFHSCTDKNLTSLSGASASNNDVDNKLFSILAMDASSDPLDSNNFSENILDNIDPESCKVNDISHENFICNIESSTIESNAHLLKNEINPNKNDFTNFKNICKNIEKVRTEKPIKSESVSVLKSKIPQEKVKPLNFVVSESSAVKPLLSNGKIIAKHNSNNFNILNTDLHNQKNKVLPIGVVQLKLSSKPQGSAILGTEKKSGIATPLPHILIKPAALETPGPHTEIKSEADFSVDNLSLSKNTKPLPARTTTSQILNGIAKVNICVDCEANTTNVSIISSNKEHTVFKINTSDLMRAVSSIKETYLEPLGLKNQQLIETANAANKLLSIHSHISHLKKGEDSSLKGPEKFEINRHIEELKSPISRARATLSAMGHILTATKVPETKCNDTTSPRAKVVSTMKMKKVEEISSQTKKLGKCSQQKLKGHGENVGISLLPGAPPTMVSVPSVLDALSGPTTSKVNIAQVLADCEFTDSEKKNETKDTQQDNISGSDEKTNDALVQLGINPNSLSPNIGPKGNKRWHCPITSCTKQFPKLSYLKVHILNHKGIRPYKCSYENCDWSFYTSYKLKRHLETHLKRRDYVCTEPSCSRRFTTIYNLNTHMTLHKRPKSWFCSLSTCGKAFHTRRELEAHMKLHVDIKPPYRCSVESCSKAYFTPNSLASHMRSHHKQEDLRCQWLGCDKRFDKPCRLRAHMRVHTGQRPYVCTYEGCNWRFQCASKLSRHQRKHTNDRKYSCPICKKAFLRSEHLKGHLLTHTGVRNFQCPVANCDAKFTAKSSLYVHLKKHKTPKTDDTKLPCPIDTCEKSYDSKLNLQQHLLKNHSQILDSNPLDYITLVSEKELNEQLLPSLIDANKPAFSPFAPLSLQSVSVETPSSALEDNSASDKEVASLPNGSIDNSLMGPLLAVSTASNLTNEGQGETSDVCWVPEGFFHLEGDSSSHASTELGFPDLPPKEGVCAGSKSKGLVFQGGSAARTDVLGNIILSQRAKRRQQLSVARKIANSDLSKTNYCHDLVLPTAVGDTLPLSANFQPSIMQDDGLSTNLYENTFSTRELISDPDPSTDSQSTINLRDLE